MIDLIKYSLVLLLGPFVVIVYIWGIPFIMQMVIVPYGPDRWNKFLADQFAKDPNAPRIDTFLIYGPRFYKYCFLYPFIRKRATSPSKFFKFYKVVMWLNALWIYSVIILVVIGVLGQNLGYIPS